MATRTIEHQQDSINGKWANSGATEHCLKWYGQFSWLHSKALSTETRKRNRKIRESLKIKVSKCDICKFSINREDGYLVKTRTGTLFVRDVSNLESTLQNQRSHYKADLTSN